MKTDIDRKNFEQLLMRNGVSEVAAANACKRYDQAEQTRKQGATEAVVRETLRTHKIGAKGKLDNKEAAVSDTKVVPHNTATGTAKTAPAKKRKRIGRKG